MSEQSNVKLDSDREPLRVNNQTVREYKRHIIGNGNIVSGIGCLVEGNENTVSGKDFVVIGTNNTLSGSNGRAYGDQTAVSGTGWQVCGSVGSLSGTGNRVRGDARSVSGVNNAVSGTASSVSGMNNAYGACRNCSGMNNGCQRLDLSAIGPDILAAADRMRRELRAVPPESERENTVTVNGQTIKTKGPIVINEGSVFVGSVSCGGTMSTYADGTVIFGGDGQIRVADDASVHFYS